MLVLGRSCLGDRLAGGNAQVPRGNVSVTTPAPRLGVGGVCPRRFMRRPGVKVHLPRGKGIPVRLREAVGIVAVLAAWLVGCASTNEEFAETVNPCCGQDEIAAGREPSEERCADLVVSRDAVMSVAWSAAAGSGMTHWRVRILPGGPACIWRRWPGLTEEDYAQAEPLEDGGASGRDGAPPDTSIWIPSAGSSPGAEPGCRGE